MAKRVLVIGFDGAHPEAMFDRWLDDLPNIKALTEKGTWGRLRSIVPPITPAAWSSAISGKNPGKIGFWDFPFRSSFAYGEPELVNRTKVQCDMLYDILPAAGKKCAFINVPVTYPPKHVDGATFITAFLTPSLESEWVWPESLKAEVEEVIEGEYILDASTPDGNFRTLPKDFVIDRIYKMDQQRWDLLKHFYEKGEDDLIWTVFMGTDRIAHIFSNYADPSHVKFEDDDKYRNVMFDHFKYMDEQLGKVMEMIDDDTEIVLMSDHGNNPLDGRFNLNDWLIQEGYMKLNSQPSEPVNLPDADVNWDETKAWATGFMGGRIFLNMKDREEHGIVEESEYESLRDEIAEKLKEVKDIDGEPFKVNIIKREDEYEGPYAKFAPDMFVQLNDLRWTSNVQIGHDTLYSYNTSLGGDVGVHSMYGIFAMSQPAKDASKPVEGIKLADVAPTVLNMLGVDVPEDLDGKSII